MTMDAQELQREIDEAVESEHAGPRAIIRLGPDADVTDLTATVGLRIRVENQKERDFTVATVKWLARACRRPGTRAEEQYFVTGGPMLVVRTICGESVVKSVIRYLEIERSL